MKKLTNDLYSVAKNLKALTQKTEKLAKELDRIQKASAKTVKKPVQAKGKRVTASEAILAIVQKSKKGVDAGTLKMKTGFNSQKIRDNIYRLKKQGKIKTVSRGIYKVV